MFYSVDIFAKLSLMYGHYICFFDMRVEGLQAIVLIPPPHVPNLTHSDSLYVHSL